VLGVEQEAEEKDGQTFNTQPEDRGRSAHE
jgi:hypothetical protein